MKKFIALLLLLSLHANSGTQTDPVENKKDTLLFQVQSALRILQENSLSNSDQDELKEYTLSEVIEIAKESEQRSISLTTLLGFTDPPGINDDGDDD